MSMGWEPGLIYMIFGRWAMNFERPFDKSVNGQVTAFRIIVDLSTDPGSLPVIYVSANYVQIDRCRTITFQYNSDDQLFNLRDDIHSVIIIPPMPYKQMIDLVNFTLRRISAEVV